MKASIAIVTVLLALFVLTVLQIILQLAFWGGLSGGDMKSAWLFQCLGGALTVLEIFLLVAASETAGLGDKSRANALCILFALLACVNLTADISAVSQYTGTGEERRAVAIRHDDQLASRVTEAEAAIARMHAQLAASGHDRPVAALTAERAALAERVARLERAGRAPPMRHVDDLAAFDSAIVLAREITTQEQARDEAITARDANPEARAGSPFASLARLAGLIGLQLEVEDVRAILALAVALAVKTVLTVGFWALGPWLAELAIFQEERALPVKAWVAKRDRAAAGVSVAPDDVDIIAAFDAARKREH